MPAGTSRTIATYAHVLDPKRKWYNNKRIIILNFWILLLLLTPLTSSYDDYIVGSFQSLPHWMQYFNYPAGGRLSILNAMSTIGSLAALPMALYVADGLGRRTSIFVGALILCAATAVQTTATSLDMFIGARFFIGFGLTFTTMAAPLLITEIAYPAYRAPLTSAYGVLLYVGVISANWSTFGAANIQTTVSWRLPSSLLLIAATLQVALIWFGPESPRWLISKNRNAEALRTLAYYHADSNEDDPLVRFEYNKIKAAIDNEVAARIGLKALFTGWPIQIVFVLASSTPWYAYPVVVALMIVGITNTDTLVLINGILQVWNLFWALLAASLVDKIGRRNLFAASMAGMTLFLSLLTACSSEYVKSGHQSAAYAFIVFLFLFFASSSLAFPTLAVSYSIEIFPYSLRAKAMAFFIFIGCGMNMFNRHVRLPIGLGPYEWNIFYVVLLSSTGIFYWIVFTETKNLTLEETGVVFSGDGIIEHAVSATENTEEGEKASQAFVRISYLPNTMIHNSTDTLP